MRTIYNAAKCVGICCLTLCVGTVNAALTHQYTFNDGTANDSVGGANGTLMGGASVSGGQVHLSGAQTDYVNLPGPAIAINTYTDATFEGWFTYDQAAGNWQRLFDFGEPEQNYIFYTPVTIDFVGNTHVNRAAVTFCPNRSCTNGSEQQANGGATLSTGAQHYVAVVVDSATNGGDGSMSVYVDGVLNVTPPNVAPPYAANPVHFPLVLVGARPNQSLIPVDPLSFVSNFNAYLGRSNFPWDPNLNGAINEFNIYDAALDAATIAAHYQAGPIPEPSTFVLAAAALIGAMLFHRRTTGVRGVVIPANDRRWR